MPVICEFRGVKVCMYYHDHLPPHVHVLGQGFSALVLVRARTPLGVTT